MIRVDEKKTWNRPGWSGRIFQFESRQFQVVSGWSRVYHQGQYLAESDEIWSKSGRAQQDLGKIWLDPSRSSRNLAGFVEIGPKSNWFVEIWPRFPWITARSRRIWSEMLNILPEMLELSIQVAFHRFWNRKPTNDLLGWVRKFETRVQQPESSNQVAAGWTQAGWRATSTPLALTKKWDGKEKK